jgi:ubiquinone/menaquinone biosynthesis C-methylase UbiE
MGVYERYVLPRLTDLSMRNAAARAERARLIPEASGVVLEVGVGSGLNLPLYGPEVRRLYALDPSLELWRLACGRAAAAPFPVEFLLGSAERIPLKDMSVDTVVTTWTLCTIPDPGRALGEMRRVLKPKGTLVFIEHGRAPEPGVRRWQERLTPLWRRIGGGCTLDRPIDALIGDSGFDVARLEPGYGRGPRVLSYLYRGLARPADCTRSRVPGQR